MVAVASGADYYAGLNLVGMEDMLVRWGRIEEIPPLGMLVVMEEALAEGMILVGMADLVRIMEHLCSQ